MVEKCYSCLSQLMLVLLIFTFLQKKWIGMEITWILWHSVNSILSHRSKHIHTVYAVERYFTCKLLRLYFEGQNYWDSIFACFSSIASQTWSTVKSRFSFILLYYWTSIKFARNDIQAVVADYGPQLVTDWREWLQFHITLVS